VPCLPSSLVMVRCTQFSTSAEIAPGAVFMGVVNTFGNIRKATSLEWRRVVPENVAVKTLNRAHSIAADVELSTGDEGVIVCHGSNIGGFTLFVKDNTLHYVHNYVGIKELTVSSDRPLVEGKHTLRYEFAPTGKPDIKAGKGSPAQRNCSSTTNSSARPTSE
jgi:hypothetical protein